MQPTICSILCFSTVCYAKEDEDEPFEEGVLSSVAGFEYEIERVLYYDVNKRDLSDFQELAEAIGF